MTGDELDREFSEMVEKDRDYLLDDAEFARQAENDRLAFEVDELEAKVAALFGDEFCSSLRFSMMKPVGDGLSVFDNASYAERLRHELGRD